MKALINSILLMLFGISLSCAQTQEQEQQGHEAHHVSLDAHLEHVQQVKDPADRKKMLGMHIHMMKEKMEAMASMEHGDMMGGGMGNMEHSEDGMDSGMMQYHNDMVNMMNQMISVQEMLLEIIDE
ncbi:MAG: hypothetical protein ACI9XC_002545 [Gammaproteobacteria bacterium]|jgi:hypothetical protein